MMNSWWITLSVLATPMRNGMNCPVDDMTLIPPIEFQERASSMPIIDYRAYATFQLKIAATILSHDYQQISRISTFNLQFL
jgi:hypothetical protein